MSTGEKVPYIGIVNAGGFATHAARDMAPVGKNGEVLKALARIGDPPISLIEHHVNLHLRHGAAIVVASVGPHDEIAEQVTRRYKGDERVRSFQVETALGTGGDLLRLLRSAEYSEIAESVGSLALFGNADTMDGVYRQGLVRAHLAAHEKRGTNITVAPTTHPGVPNEGQYLMDENNMVVYCGESEGTPKVDIPTDRYDPRYPAWRWQGSSTGLVAVSTEYIGEYPWSPSDDPLSLYAELIPRAITENQVAAYDSGDAFLMDLGTEESWRSIQQRPELVQPYLCYETA